MTRAEIIELLTYGQDSFTLIEHRPDGSMDIYRGKEIHRFVAYDRSHRHSHTVKDKNGQVVFSRDYDGVVHIGTAVQLLVSMRRLNLVRGAGRTAARGTGSRPNVVGSSARRALRFWTKGMSR